MSDSERPILVIIMGVSGSGKSTLAQLFAQTHDFTYLDGDDFHSTRAKAIMASGQGLTAEMRQLWVNRMCIELESLYQYKRHYVLAFSGLKKAHRQQLGKLPFSVKLFLLAGEKALVAERLNNRDNHFAKADFLASQLRDFEPLTADERHIQLLPLELSLPTLCQQISQALPSKHKDRLC